MKLKKYCLVAFIAFLANFSLAQEGIPIYSDYLTDNYYLIHPSMAGVANCAKVRLTARQQWFGVDDAPSLQTMSLNGRLGDSPVALGGVLFNDSNGYHSTVGGYATFAYHLMFSRNEIDLNMLSFGLSAGFLQYNLDQSEFFFDGPDPIINGNEQSATNFNIDFGFSYHFIDFYAHFTAKNILDNDGINWNGDDDFEYKNLRTYMLSTGYTYSKFGSEWSYEPSLMYMYRDATEESSIDINAKVYKQMDFGKVWGGLSYRRSLDGAEFRENAGSGVSNQKLQYITPFVGVDYNNFVFAYTYSYQMNTVNFNTGGFHQFTLGYNFNCRRAKYECNCPAVN